MKEIWKPIDGYEGYYEVSNLGRVRSLDREIIDSIGRFQHRKGKIKIQTLNSDGYPTVNLSKNNIDKRICVHILVGNAFVSNYFDSAEINHIDCDRTNNCADNLEWITHEENVRYSIITGNHVSVSTDYSGKNNPNYGNHKLGKLYANNKELSKLKQGRKGNQNGRSIKIKMISPLGKQLLFDYIGECAEYLINNGITRTHSIDSVRTAITQSIKSTKPYLGYNFEKVR